MKTQNGFTIIELMVVVAIAAILLAAATPSMSSWITASKVRTATNDIVFIANLAKSEAVKRRKGMIIQAVNNKTDLSDGMRLVVDDTANTVVYEMAGVDDVIKITMSGGSFGATGQYKFQANGMPDATSKGLEVTICGKGLDASRQRRVKLGISGRPQVVNKNITCN